MRRQAFPGPTGGTGNRRVLDDDEFIDDNNQIVRDGHGVRVPVLTMDGRTPPRWIKDSNSKDTAPVRRSAWDNAARALSGSDLYDEQRQRLSDAWRNPREGVSVPFATTDGHPIDDEAERRGVIDMEPVYAECAEYLANAWKNPR
jgi:hypothetical protein